MEVEFKREMNRNYMVLKPEPTGRGKHTIRMLTENQVPGLLPFHEKKINGDCRYYYDITSRQPLERILEYRKLSGVEIKQLIADMLFVLKEMERFLLDESQICLKPDMIYVEPDSFHCCLCVVPGKNGCFSEKFCALSQYLLDHIDHNDGEAVVMAFGIFRESRKENFGIEDIEACLHLSGNQTDRGSAWDGDGCGLTEKEVRKEEDGNEDNISELKHQREAIQTEKQGKLWRGLPVAFMIGIPVLIGGIGGVSELLRYRWTLGAVELLLAAGLIFLADRKKGQIKNINKAEAETMEEEWTVYFENESEKGNDNLSEALKETDLDKKAETEPEGDAKEEFQTILLTARPLEQELHRLIPLNGGQEIPIHYFPFLIGKSKSITDFCLDIPEISRLHMKIEETPSGYMVTDLNSTNGTQINGHILEANETYPLLPGDEVMIATKKYRFL